MLGSPDSLADLRDSRRSVTDREVTLTGFRTERLRDSRSPTATTRGEQARLRAKLAAAEAERGALQAEVSALRARQEHVESAAERLASLTHDLDGLLSARVAGAAVRGVEMRTSEASPGPGVLVTRLFRRFDVDQRDMLCH